MLQQPRLCRAEERGTAGSGPRPALCQGEEGRGPTAVGGGPPDGALP